MKFKSVNELVSKATKKFLKLNLMFSSIDQQGAFFKGVFEGKEVVCRITSEDGYLFSSSQSVEFLISNYESVYLVVNDNVILDI